MSNSSRKGKLFIVSAPSGAGKTTLCTIVLQKVKGIERSVSYTTRPKRSSEINGREYHFVSEDVFKEMVSKGRFAEWAIVHGNHYGTDKVFIEGKISSGIDVLLNIDIQGGDQLIKMYPDAVTIFIHAPSFEDLKKRLMERKSDTQTTIEKRLHEAEKELKAADSYKFQMVNDEIERASQELISLIESQRNGP